MLFIFFSAKLDFWTHLSLIQNSKLHHIVFFFFCIICLLLLTTIEPFRIQTPEGCSALETIIYVYLNFSFYHTIYIYF